MYENWTVPMKRYEIRSRLEPIIRAYVDGLPCGTAIDTAYILDMTDLDGFDDADIYPALKEVLDGMSGEYGTLTCEEGEYRKKGLMEMAEIEDAAISQYHRDNMEWYAGCVLMAVLGVMWLVSHIWGAEIGMKMIYVPFLGLPFTMYDWLFISGIAMLVFWRWMDRMNGNL